MNKARPSLSSHLARRLDRLSLAAHRFHRFAHHPLCAEYAGEVFRIGRKTRICKGCTLAGLGAVAGFAIGGFAPTHGWSYVGLAFGLIPLLTGFFLWKGGAEPLPQVHAGSPEAEALSASHRMPPRRGKLLSRFLPTAVFSFTCVEGLRIGGATGFLGALLAVGCAALIMFAYRRRSPQRQPCRTCPERFEMHRCRGYRAIRTRERAFQRLAGRIIQSTGN